MCRAIFLSLLLFVLCLNVAFSAPQLKKNGKKKASLESTRNLKDGEPEKHTPCTAKEADQVHQQFQLCQAKAQSKFRNGKVDICKYFEESIEYCGSLVAKCKEKKDLQKMKEKALRVSVRTLEVEQKWQFEECAILKEYDIEWKPFKEENEEYIDGKCTSARFTEAFGLFMSCKKESEQWMSQNLAQLSDKENQDQVDQIVCDHFEHTLNNCFTFVRKCATSEANWTATRKAFIDTIKKTNKSAKTGLNLRRCKMYASESRYRSREKLNY